jgi:hypothetical protein
LWIIVDQLEAQTYAFSPLLTERNIISER